MANDLKHLGKPSPLPDHPDVSILEKIPNPHAETKYLVRFTCPEFTSICPVTGQPDFASLMIDYVPSRYIVESKSLKLYLGSFRNHGAFHEASTLRIALDICRIIHPEWIRIGGYWYPRGGMPIDVFYQSGKPPKGVWIPKQDVRPYRGRG